MAGVRIDSGELPSAVGAEGDALMQVITKWQWIASGRFPEDCEALLQMVDETDRLRLWEKDIGGFTFKDRNEFLQKRVLINFDLAEDALVGIVERLRRGETVTMRAQRIAKAVKAAVTPAQAGAQGGRGNKAIDNVKSFGGNSASYLAGVLKRDHPEIAEQLAAGKFRSVRAAAKAAGIVQEKTPFDQLNYWWAKASPDEQKRFLKEKSNG